MAAESITTIMDRWEKQLLDTAKRAMELMTEEVVENTPVLMGELKASWTPNNGGPVALNQESGVQNFMSVIDTIQIGDTYTLANGRPYGPRIEYEGWSNKAPEGMIQPALPQWQSMVDQAVRENK